MRVYHNTLSYIKLVSIIHDNKYDYSKTEFTKMSENIIVICPSHGEFYPSAGNHKRTGCPSCYDRSSTLRQDKSVFLAALKKRPLYALAGEYLSASVKVTLKCIKHQTTFACTPCRLLTYDHTCPKCNIENQNLLRQKRNRGRVAKALAALPDNIACLAVRPSWSESEKFACKYHGVFSSELDRASKMQYVCNECAKEHFKGTARTTWQEYSCFLRSLFPKPPSPFTLDKESYEKNIGTRLVNIICDEHGRFSRNRSTVNNGKLHTPCPFCKAQGTSTPELEVLEFVRSLVPAVQGNRTVIKPKELDILVESKKLAIEFCGLYWHSEAKLNKTYHVDKLKECNDKGYDLIQIFEDEWIEKREICESIIKNKLGFNMKSFYARKLTISFPSSKDARVFFLANHIQGFVGAQKYMSLVCPAGEVVAMASFSKGRLKKDGKWELVRYCSVLGSTVVGGLSRLCQNFMRSECVDYLMTYCCLRWFNGKGYEKAGFTLERIGDISYFYTNKQIRFSRYKTKKQKLAKLLPDYDPELTETANMEKAGFLKIYGCGNAVYVIKKGLNGFPFRPIPRSHR